MRTMDPHVAWSNSDGRRHRSWTCLRAGVLDVTVGNDRPTGGSESTRRDPDGRTVNFGAPVCAGLSGRVLVDEMPELIATRCNNAFRCRGRRVWARDDLPGPVGSLLARYELLNAFRGHSRSRPQSNYEGEKMAGREINNLAGRERTRYSVVAARQIMP